MKKFFMYAIILFAYVGMTANVSIAQLNTYKVSDYLLTIDSWSNLGSWYVEIVYDKVTGNYLLRLETDVPSEDNMIDVDLGKDKQSAIKSLNQIRSVQNETDFIYINQSDGVIKMYHQSDVICFKQEGTKGKGCIKPQQLWDFREAVRKFKEPTT